MNEIETSAWASFPIDREIVITRVIDADRETVFDAWVVPDHIEQWFGPKGWRTRSIETDIREGGVWRFLMIAPDGNEHGNRMRFIRIQHPFLIEIEHGADTEDDPNAFRVLVTFDEQSDGKTVVTLRQMHPSSQQRQDTIGFGAVEYGLQTLKKLSAHVSEQLA